MAATVEASLTSLASVMVVCRQRLDWTGGWNQPPWRLKRHPATPASARAGKPIYHAWQQYERLGEI